MKQSLYDSISEWFKILQNFFHHHQMFYCHEFLWAKMAQFYSPFFYSLVSSVSKILLISYTVVLLYNAWVLLSFFTIFLSYRCCYLKEYLKFFNFSIRLLFQQPNTNQHSKGHWEMFYFKWLFHMVLKMIRISLQN